jgi:hypothetical protein
MRAVAPDRKHTYLAVFLVEAVVAEGQVTLGADKVFRVPSLVLKIQEWYSKNIL